MLSEYRIHVFSSTLPSPKIPGMPSVEWATTPPPRLQPLASGRQRALGSPRDIPPVLSTVGHWVLCPSCWLKLYDTAFMGKCCYYSQPGGGSHLFIALSLWVECEVIIECRCLSLFSTPHWIVFIKKEITVVCLELKSEQITQKEESQEGGQEATYKEKQKQV